MSPCRYQHWEQSFCSSAIGALPCARMGGTPTLSEECGRISDSLRWKHPTRLIGEGESLPLSRSRVAVSGYPFCGDSPQRRGEMERI